jgi:hypothetical protein
VKRGKPPENPENDEAFDGLYYIENNAEFHINSMYKWSFRLYFMTLTHSNFLLLWSFSVNLLLLLFPINLTVL